MLFNWMQLMHNLHQGRKRLCEKLYQNFGEEIHRVLNDAAVTEIILDPNGSLWTTDKWHDPKPIMQLDAKSALAIIDAAANIHGKIVSNKQPYLKTTLPIYRSMRGELFTAQIPPLVASPSFSIRKKNVTLPSLKDYRESKRINDKQFDIFNFLIEERKNILICGEPGSGKTTFLNALLQEAITVDIRQRFFILEDTAELVCSAPNTTSLLSNKFINMNRLIRTAMRLFPNRIVVGEVHDHEMLDVFNIWNTNCPGGLATVRAENTHATLQNIMKQSVVVGTKALLEQAQQVLVGIQRRRGQPGYVTEIIALKGMRHGQFIFESLV